jgi:hypothetical protein
MRRVVAGVLDGRVPGAASGRVGRARRGDVQAQLPRSPGVAGRHRRAERRGVPELRGDPSGENENDSRGKKACGLLRRVFQTVRPTSTTESRIKGSRKPSSTPTSSNHYKNTSTRSGRLNCPNCFAAVKQRLGLSVEEAVTHLLFLVHSSVG